MFPQIRIAGDELSKVDDLLGREWLVTNGLGGYASSTVLGVNTRKYHGLLVAAFRPPRRRMVCITKTDEILKIRGASHPLYTNEFQCGISPAGYRFMESFSLSPFPRYVYNVLDVRLTKTILMPREENATIILYDVESHDASDIEVLVYPLLACRHFHAVLDKWWNPKRFTQKNTGGGVKVRAEEPRAAVIINPINCAYNPSESWLEKIYYREEHLRGESYMEDWYQPGFFALRVGGGREKFALVAVAGEDEDLVERTADEMPETIQDVESLYAYEGRRCEGLIEKFYEEHKGVDVEDWLSWLIYAADAFIVRAIGKAGDFKRSVIAGYHWFEDWGRDTFISLPGLMLVTGRFEDARKTFLMFNEYSLDGLIPNLISDLDMQPDYNALDATLWYMNAVLQYLKYTGDFTFVERELWEGIRAFAENLIEGEYKGMRVDGDGLILHGPRMTWMDAAVDGRPVTPRDGKAVEIQALWFNTLKTLEILAKKFKDMDGADRFAALAEEVKASFNKVFWNPVRNCLFDSVDKHGRGDPSIRPNQIIAASLDFTMLDSVRMRMIVDTVHRELLTPYGLRTLNRSDPRYTGVYWGDRRRRDLAYHNGTVWPWLLGPFITAYLRTEGYSVWAREYAYNSFLLPLLSEQIFRAGLGFISEIFDGNPPHIPRGCIAQAWSIAEPLRTYVEDIMLIRPRFEREVLQVC